MMMVREALRFHSAENLYSQPLKEGIQFRPRGELNLVLIQGLNGDTESGTVRETRMHMLNATGDEPFNTQFSEQSLPKAFYPFSLCMVTEGNYLFLFGADAEYIRPVAMRFDVKTNTWLDLKSLPYTASTYTAATLLKGKIYLIGGMHITEGSENYAASNKYLESFSEYSIQKIPGQNCRTCQDLQRIIVQHHIRITFFVLVDIVRT